MANFFASLANGIQSMGDTPEGERYTVADIPVTCAHCKHDHFVEGRAQLNTAGMTFFNLDWANRSARSHQTSDVGETGRQCCPQNMMRGGLS